MEVVQKAVNDAMHAVRNSPLLRRRFGDREDPTEEQEELSPEKDRTPFVQGFSYRVEYLGKATVEPGQEQDHGCCDRAVELLWSESETCHTLLLSFSPKILSLERFPLSLAEKDCEEQN